MTATAQAPLMSTPAMIRLNTDPLDWPRIPKPVKDKLRRLRRARDDARLLRNAIADERQEASDTKKATEARLTVLTGGRSDSEWYGGVQHASFHRLADDDPQVVGELQALEDAKANIERLNPIVEACSHRSQTIGRLLSSIESYLTEGLSRVSGAITLYKGPSSSPRKREAPVEAVERCQHRLRELAADRHRIISAPWHAAGAKLRARAEIEELAERGRPNVLPLIETAEASIAWRERFISEVPVGAGQLITAFGDPQALPLLFWLHREALIQKIEAEVDAVSDDAVALTAGERKEQLEVIDRDFLSLQRDEEFFISAAIDDGATVLRRPDADPRAVLGLSDEMPAPVVA